jgi:hypothetical protein
MISGRPEFLKVFAQSLPCDAHDASSVPYHVHFGRSEFANRITEASLDIVLREE